MISRYYNTVVLVRIGSVFGPFYTAGRNPILMMIKNAVNGVSTILSPSEATFYDYIYVKDCARAVGLLHLKHPLKYRIYNIGGGEKAVGIQEVAQAVRKSIPKAEIEIEPRELQTKGLWMDISRIRAEIGYEPEFTLESGVEAFIKFSRRIPRPVDGDECGAGVRGMQSPSSSFLRCPALWAG